VEYQTDDGHKRQCDQHELTVEVDRLTSNADEIRFSVIADELDAHFSFRLDRTPFIQPANATARDLAIVRSRSNIPLSAYFRVHPPAFFFADFSYVIGDLLFPAPDNNLSHFSDQQIETVNWDAENVLITQEYGDCLPNISIHDYIEGRLKGEQCDIVFFDHLSPEAADFITLKEFAERIELCFYHCKGSSRKEPASRSEDLIEVVGQAGKSVRWLHNLSALRGKIDKRVKLKPERFIVGTLAEFDRLVLAARTKQLHLVVVAVQPGLSKQQMDDPASSLLGATDAYLVRARCSHLRVIGSE
jgi:hypothetical protein